MQFVYIFCFFVGGKVIDSRCVKKFGSENAMVRHGFLNLMMVENILLGLSTIVYVCFYNSRFQLKGIIYLAFAYLFVVNI